MLKSLKLLPPFDDSTRVERASCQFPVFIMHFFQILLIFLIVAVLEQNFTLAAIAVAPKSRPGAVEKELSTKTANAKANNPKYLDAKVERLVKDGGGDVEPLDLTKVPRIFSFEAQTPQRVIVGCQGTQMPNGQLRAIYYIIDATGRKKYVEPGQYILVVFPSSNTTGLAGGASQSRPESAYVPAPTSNNNSNRIKYVGFHEICFPNECNSPNCGFTIGPLPAHPTLGTPEETPADQIQGMPIQTDPVTTTVAVEVAGEAAGSGWVASAAGISGLGTSDSGPPPPPPPPGSTGWTPCNGGGNSGWGSSSSGSESHAEASGGDSGATAGADVGVSGSSSSGSSGGESGGGGDSSSSSGAGASGSSSSSSESSDGDSDASVDTGAGAGAGGSSGSGDGDSGASAGAGAGSSSGSGGESSAGGSASSSSGSESGGESGGSWGEGGGGGEGGSWPGEGGDTPGCGTPGTPGCGTPPGGDTPPPTCGTPGTPSCGPPPGGETPPPTCGTPGTPACGTPPGGETPPPTCGTPGTPACGTPPGGETPPPPTGGTPPGGGGGGCPVPTCDCCHLCTPPPPQHPPQSTSLPPGPTSFIPNMFPGFIPGAPHFAGFGTKESIGKEVSKDRTDASYYSSLPGAIIGGASVIYYPSCERDAYVQPAIINYCPTSESESGESGQKKKSVKRDSSTAAVAKMTPIPSQE